MLYPSNTNSLFLLTFNSAPGHHHSTFYEFDHPGYLIEMTAYSIWPFVFGVWLISLASVFRIYASCNTHHNLFLPGGWIISHCVYVPHFACLPPHLWTLGLHDIHKILLYSENVFINTATLMPLTCTCPIWCLTICEKIEQQGLWELKMKGGEGSSRRGASFGRSRE